MSRAHALPRFFAAALLRNFVPYALASVAAAIVVVACVQASETAQGRSMGFENLVIVAVCACVATFVFALPASALLIGIGEWKKLGPRYHVGAGFLAATVSWLAVIAEAFLHDRRGDGVPFLRFDDLIMLLSVGFGGAVGGFVFVRARNALVRWLGTLGFPTPEPEHENP